MTAGPYIVTHEQVHPPSAYDIRVGESRRLHETFYRKAFATLEDARAACRGRISVAWIAAGRPSGDMAWHSLSLSGATHGLDAGGSITLPNGDVIEVEATTWATLFDEIADAADLGEVAARLAADAYAMSRHRLLAAWNAEHGIGVAREHAAGCAWRRANPCVDGDEAANCDCGLIERESLEHGIGIGEQA